MRDPRESKLWVPFNSDPAPRSVGDSEELRQLVGDEVERFRERCKVLSMSVDRRSDDIYSRGFAKPRMWEQYGDAYRGVCLGFHRHALSAAAAASLEGQGLLEAGFVAYWNEDAIIEVSLAAARRNPRRAIDATFDDQWQPMFLRKLTDWAQEDEYRFILHAREAEPVYREVEFPPEALSFVYVGEDSADAVDTFARWCRERYPSAELGILYWTNAHPNVWPIL
jgi:hypothetical protein